MTQRFRNPGFSSKPYNGSIGLQNSPANRKILVFLVATQRPLPPPSLQRGNSLQQMAVMLLEKGEPAAFDPSDLVIGPLPEAVPPMPPALPTSRPMPLYPRRVQGEILCDEAGRLYERIGRQLRSLHRLASGPHGEVLDLAPPVQAKLRPHSPVAERPMGHDKQSSAGPPPVDGHDQEEPNAPNRSTVVSPPMAAPAVPAPPLAHRKLFPDPGQWRVLQWGDFKRVLAPQLAHPEGLRDTHQLPCYVQVYEALTPQPLESLATTALGDPRGVSQLLPLTDAMARKLGLAALPQRRPQVPPHMRRESDVILPHDRVFRLQLAHDPTMREGLRDSRRPQPAPEPVEPHTSAVNTDATPAVNCLGLKAAVPERFLKPWEFQLGREEVLFDMHVSAARRRGLSSLLRWLIGRAGGRREFRKWQLLLCGKSLEEQLWAIRPPKGGLSHPGVREWAQMTLELAGYNPHAMLLEWEIFWRRKGL
jgi:hypothetical protein